MLRFMIINQWCGVPVFYNSVVRILQRKEGGGVLRDSKASTREKANPPNLLTEAPTMEKLLTVFGATGQQGGNLIDHILHHPELSEIYRLRGVTRDISKPAAVALQDKGVEMVQVKRAGGGCSTRERPG